jgi:asparagine synthase (glutamine-hydrolysing)
MVAVAFSGGLDSSVLVACARNYTKVVAVTAMVDGSQEGGRAKSAAELLGADLVITTVAMEAAAQELQAMKLPFEPTLMDASLWCLYTVAARGAARSGAEVILLGQLADELFGGYAKYRDALREEGEEKAAEMMRQDVEEFPRRGRVRDAAACERWLQPKFPYEDEAVRGLGLGLPVSFKISGAGSKLVLRRAASILGVPDELTSRPKKAAQYSSGIQKMVSGTSLFNGRRTADHHDSITAAKGEAGGVQGAAGEVQLLQP